jgi:hypothetical protein
MWESAICQAAAGFDLPASASTTEAVLVHTLGEGWRGPRRWQLSPAVRVYYLVKPWLPRQITRQLRRRHAVDALTRSELGWPVEDRYVRFQWEVMGHLLRLREEPPLPFYHFWPAGYEYGFTLTHDVEAAEGHALIAAVADLEERYGFRSSFNIVPERYPLDHGLLQDLRQRGFEIGLHGLKHDGHLFRSQAEFMRRAARINSHLQAQNATGFRAPYNHRHPEWMQALEIDYDLSFFDTDPFEPLPGGTMSIWPYFIGRFVELPATLVQDHTLVMLLGERSPRLWLEKVDFLERYRGLALVDTHPDYLRDDTTWQVYADFLQAMREREGYWHALPRDIARWWRARSEAQSDSDVPDLAVRRAVLSGDEVVIE